MTSLHVSVFPVLWLYPAGKPSPWWFTELHSFTSWVPETLLRETWGSSDALLEHKGLGNWGMLWGRDAGRTWRGEPVAVSSVLRLSVPPHHLWDGVCLWHSLLAGSRPNPPLTSPCHGASVLQKLGGSQAWAGGGQNPCPRSPPEQDPGKPLPLTHSLPPTVPWCGLTQPLIYEPSTWLVVWWLLF